MLWFIQTKTIVSKDLVPKKYYLLKGFIKKYNVSINLKKFYEQPNNSYTKQYEVIIKLTTGQGEDYTTA